jgi:hypothetical protein
LCLPVRKQDWQTSADFAVCMHPVQQELHDDQGRPYYYNTSTGASVWEKPAELA